MVSSLGHETVNSELTDSLPLQSSLSLAREKQYLLTDTNAALVGKAPIRPSLSSRPEEQLISMVQLEKMVYG